jgi:CBS domain-containing protein
MLVGEMMSKTVRTCAPNDNLAEATNLMWEQDCGVLPVVEDGRLEGILTDRDICIALGTRNRRASEIDVKEVATRDVKTCSPETDVEAAMALMRRAKVRRLPVVDNGGQVIGIITLNDLVMTATPKRGPIAYEDVVDTLKAVSAPWHHSLDEAGKALPKDFPSIPVAVA